MSGYPEDEQGRKKAIAANLKFHEPSDQMFAARTEIKARKSAIETLIKLNHVPPRATEFLHNASCHLAQALKIIDEAEKCS